MVEKLLNNPDMDRKWWSRLRACTPQRPSAVPARIEAWTSNLDD
jgi:hypothetical protein